MQYTPLFQLIYDTGVFIVTVVIRHQLNNHCQYIGRVYKYVSTLSACNTHRNCGNWIISHRTLLADGKAETKLKLSAIAESKYRCTYWRL